MWNSNREDRGAGGPILRDPLAQPQRNEPYNVNNRSFNFNQQQRNGSGSNDASDQQFHPEPRFSSSYNHADYSNGQNSGRINNSPTQNRPNPNTGGFNYKAFNNSSQFNNKTEGSINSLVPCSPFNEKTGVFKDNVVGFLRSEKPPPGLGPSAMTPPSLMSFNPFSGSQGSPFQQSNSLFSSDTMTKFGDSSVEKQKQPSPINSPFNKPRQESVSLMVQPDTSDNPFNSQWNAASPFTDQVDNSSSPYIQWDLPRTSFNQPSQQQQGSSSVPVPLIRSNNKINSPLLEHPQQFKSLQFAQNQSENAWRARPPVPTSAVNRSANYTRNQNFSNDSVRKFPSDTFTGSNANQGNTHTQFSSPNQNFKDASFRQNQNSTEQERPTSGWVRNPFSPQTPISASQGRSFNTFNNKGQNNSNSNSNNVNVPLLPTPKLVPYPPPPLPPGKQLSKGNAPVNVLLRNPRGLYSDFVKEGKQVMESSNSTSTASPRTSFTRNSLGEISFTVVPYSLEDGEDNDEEELLPEKPQEVDSKDLTHDFFSSKMIQHMASLLTGKPLEEQLPEVIKHALLPPEYLASRVSIVRNLHVMLTEKFKKCCVYPYGADFIGIGSSDDSVNVFIDLTAKQGTSINLESKEILPLDVCKSNIDELLALIQEDTNHKFFGQIIKRTNFNSYHLSLPVISFIHTETRVRCNLRMDNYLLVQEAKVVQYVCSLDTRIVPLLALARYWSSVHKVLDTPEEDTKNRFITLLVLFFLAQKKIVPTMAHIKNLRVKPEYFEGIDIAFCDDYSLIPQNDNPALKDKMVFCLSTLSLLREFFRTFSIADLKKNVVSLWNAELIPKENFHPSNENALLTPDLRKNYRYFANGNIREKRIDCRSRMCVQDFQDLTENLTISLAEYDVQRFQLECQRALLILESLMECGSGNVMDLFEINEYDTYGSSEHLALHEMVYFLSEISEAKALRKNVRVSI